MPDDANTQPPSDQPMPINWARMTGPDWASLRRAQPATFCGLLRANFHPSSFHAFIRFFVRGRLRIHFCHHR